MTKLLLLIFMFAACAGLAPAQIYLSPDAVKTTAIDGEQLKTLARSTENKKPVLINFWATWCGPCRAEFADLVAIDTDYREKGLDFVIVSVDDFGVIDSRIPEFLEQYEAKMPSFLIDLDSEKTVKAIRKIAPRFSGSYPFTALFNAKGRLVYQKAGVIDPKILRSQIEKVLPQLNYR